MWKWILIASAFLCSCSYNDEYKRSDDTIGEVGIEVTYYGKVNMKRFVFHKFCVDGHLLYAVDGKPIPEFSKEECKN